MYREPKEFQNIRDLLEKNPGGLTPKDFAEKLPLCKNTIAKYLAMMHVLGQIDERPIGTTKLYTLSRRVPMDELMDLISDLVTVVDHDMKIIQINGRLLEFLSLKKEELPFGSLQDSKIPLLSSPTSSRKLRGPFGQEVQGRNLHPEREYGTQVDDADYPDRFDAGETRSSHRTPGIIISLFSLPLPTS